MTLNSSGAISQGSASVITATTLAGGSNGAVTLTGANQIANLGTFTNTGTGAVSITTAETLTLIGAVNAGATNDLTLTMIGAGHGLVLGSNAVTGALVTLTSTDIISQSAAGVITASTLDLEANGAVTLNGINNNIGNFGRFVDLGADISVTLGATLNLTGEFSAGTHNLTLTTTGAGHDIVLGGNPVTGATVTLTSAGGISQTSAGVITATTLTGQSNGAVTLNGANQISNLGAFTNTGTGAVSITNAGALTCRRVMPAPTMTWRPTAAVSCSAATL